MDFLSISGKRYLVFGVANKRSVAYFVTRLLLEAGAECVLSVESEDRAKTVRKLFPETPIHICNLENSGDILSLRRDIGDSFRLDGIVHSVAYANYSNGLKPFHQTRKDDFLQAMGISTFSLMEISNAFKDALQPDASVVTLSISTTRMASESYGYMGPVKAALDSSICFLAKSFSGFSRIRFNAVCAGLLKTSSSAGIPGYLDNYLYAEEATLRKENLRTEEVANAVLFMLSPRSSGINAQRIVIDAGMCVNYFDRSIIEKVVKPTT